MAKEPTLALTKKAKLTADRLTMLMVKQYRKNASTSGFRPELIKKVRLCSYVSFQEMLLLIICDTITIRN